MRDRRDELSGTVARLLGLGLVLIAARSGGTPTQVPRAEPLRFARGHAARDIPFEITGNHIYVRARVGASRAFWLLLDTGATASYLDQDAGAKDVFTKGPNQAANTVLEIGSARVLDQVLLPRRIGFSRYDGRHMDGLLGYDFLRRFVVEIDYLRKRLHLHDPAGYRYSGRGKSLPLIMLGDDSGGQVPLVTVRVLQKGRAPVEGKFIADTGARVSISFNTPFIEQHKFLEYAGKTVQAPLGGGAMLRESVQPVGRVPEVHLGTFKLPNLIATYFQARQGIMASTDFDGVVGGEMLRRFRTIFDYSRKRLILEPNRAFVEEEPFDQAGVLIAAEPPNYHRFVIRQVMANSPASEAGFVPGDEIVAMNGKPASRLTLEQVRATLRGRSSIRGIAVLKIKRGTAIQRIALPLRKML